MATLAALGCASEDKQMRRDLDVVREEIRSVQRQNAELGKQLDALAARVDGLAVRLAERPAAPEARPAPAAPVVPPNLAVVRIAPPRSAPPGARRASRAPPPIPTQVPVQEPGPGELAALGAARGDLGARAQADLDAAHRLSGLAEAKALESFVARYPRHPAADNALVEAAGARAGAGEGDAACALYARCAEEYPAGDALPEALERLGECLARRGQEERARSLFRRVAADYPDTPAARRAGERIAAMPAASAARQGAVP